MADQQGTQAGATPPGSEEFQKALWLKKKAVLDTHYCFTLDKIQGGARDALYPLIAQNIAQRAEWRDLYSADRLDGWSEDSALSRDFLDSNPHLSGQQAFCNTMFRKRIILYSCIIGSALPYIG